MLHVALPGVATQGFTALAAGIYEALACGRGVIGWSLCSQGASHRLRGEGQIGPLFVERSRTAFQPVPSALTRPNDKRYGNGRPAALAG